MFPKKDDLEKMDSYDLSKIKGHVSFKPIKELGLGGIVNEMISLHSKLDLEMTLVFDSKLGLLNHSVSDEYSMRLERYESLKNALDEYGSKIKGE